MDESALTAGLPADITACPRCGTAPLEKGDEDWHCRGCGTRWPLLDRVPALFAEPVATLDEWRGRLHALLVQLDAHRQRLVAALGDEGLPPRTRQRLELLAAASDDHRERLAALLAPLGMAGHRASHETHLALRTRLPADQGLTTYYPNIHRDWAWGEAENAASLELLLPLLGNRVTGRVLVLGAGAGRLAFDLHQGGEASLTVALDFNPLLVLLLDRLARGEQLGLYEFPLAPRKLEDHAVLRGLAAPAPARPGFVPLLADALRPPFAPGSFDLVVTPWVIDILPETPAVQVARINALLGPGGRWLQFGSLQFSSADPVQCPGLEEMLDLVRQAGFAEPDVRNQEIPYMCSPASRHGRRERVVAWCAEKRQDVPAPSRHRALPDWLVTGRDPVPLLPAFEGQVAATRIHLFIMSLIDGRRSLKEMAQLLEAQKLMSRQEAEQSIRSFLIRMFEDAARGSRLG
ncbi:MAG: class I SAM-dependent methyltransferase [Chromatiales bacterium]|nr:class I SAM-dependent methyltransferase [Chromatiales bacterium]